MDNHWFPTSTTSQKQTSHGERYLSTGLRREPQIT
jgi:hypothetical protein